MYGEGLVVWRGTSCMERGYLYGEGLVVWRGTICMERD